MIMFAPKLHQENVKNIHDFIWRICVSYRVLNTVKQYFTFAIPRCADSIEDFGDLNGLMFFITLDARQGCHQITVRFWDQEKLAFFCPYGSKKKFEVMPFGTKNAPFSILQWYNNSRVNGVQTSTPNPLLTSLIHHLQWRRLHHLLVVRLLMGVKLWLMIFYFTLLICTLYFTTSRV